MPKKITCPKCNSTEVERLGCPSCEEGVERDEPCSDCYDTYVIVGKMECIDCGYEFDE